MREPSDRLRTMCREKCQGGKYETGSGTCALICMENIAPRSSPHGCPHAVAVFAHTFERPRREDD